MALKHLAAVLAAAMLMVFPVSGSASAETFRIVGFGDSLMAGYGLGPGEGFTDRLQAALQGKGHDVEVANAGVSGDTTSGGLARIDWSVPDGTDLVILELGANDMLRGVQPEVTRQNLDAMLQRLEKRGIPVLLAGMMAAPNLGADYGDAFNSIFPDLAKQYDATLYPFFLDGVAGDRKLVLEDGMHPNSAGISRMVDGVMPFVERLILDRPSAS
ncbi:arylesterase [Mesorhizobium sp. NBSH29]|uniref:arylesterase n=1 Tax=Mesorhizobium sp. NBSH29 TaxID=2654249 RepID=UPI00189690A2|nr:arylesterase [Mesorhizobium sp. NBSH29]QPC86006.1 arylesterase [Mesorhizobium sp. NBSH29]